MAIISTATPYNAPRDVNGVPWDTIADNATCSLLQAGSGISASIAINSVLTGQIWGVVGGAAGLIAAQATAALAGCYPINEDDGPSHGGSSNIVPGSCLETEGCDLLLRDKDGLQWAGSRVRKLNYIVDDGTYPNGTPRVRYSYINCDNEEVVNYDSATRMPVSTQVADGGVCVGDPAPPDSPVLPDPIPVPDPRGGECVFMTQLVDAYINESGGMSILWEICPTGDACATNVCTRLWYHGPGQIQPAPQPCIPGPDGECKEPRNPRDSNRDILEEIKKCACRDPEPPAASIAAREFLFTSACGENDDGSVANIQYQLAGAEDLSSCFNALASQNYELMRMIQQHLLWKTPICKPEKPELRGSWVTTRWISDEKMDHSGKRLRKLLRYRSESSRNLGQLSAYWQDFTWTAGEVCVIHKGAWWGTPQVWASTQEEGQRVLRFAAAEAGIDPDQAGEWGVSSSSSPRYGMSGTMRILRYEGFPWVAQRSGPDFPNKLALQLDP